MMFLVFMTCMQFCFLDCLRVIFSLRFWQSSLVCVEPFCRALIFFAKPFCATFFIALSQGVSGQALSQFFGALSVKPVHFFFPPPPLLYLRPKPGRAKPG